MKTVLIVLLIIFMVMVVVSLVRGVIAFLKSTKTDLESGGEGEGASPMQLQQNRMMMARIKYQALAIDAVAVLLMMTS